ncbi:MAG: hypothetical protein WKF37_08640 [Bryobacteraceae bacterium]
MPVPERIAAAAEGRVGAAAGEIQRSVEEIEAVSHCEPNASRKEKLRGSPPLPKLAWRRPPVADNQDPATLGLAGESLSRAEALQGKTVDYLGVAWLDAGRLASKAVARILFDDGARLEPASSSRVASW